MRNLPKKEWVAALHSFGRSAGGILIGYTVWSLSGYSIKQVVGRSMQPTFNPHLAQNKQVSHKHESTFHWFSVLLKDKFEPLDWVLVGSKDRYKLKTGDIVTLYNPLVSTDRDIKRVAATAHQVVVTKGYKNKTVIVPEGYIWVEGDNHARSKDSNTYGPIPAALVFGKAVAIVFPPWRWQRLTSDSPNTKSLMASERNDD